MIYNYGANELCTDVHPKPACTQTRLAANRNHKVKLGKQLSVRSSFNLTLQLQREGSSGPFWVSCSYVHTHSITRVEMTALWCSQQTERRGPGSSATANLPELPPSSYGLKIWFPFLKPSWRFALQPSFLHVSAFTQFCAVFPLAALQLVHY